MSDLKKGLPSKLKKEPLIEAIFEVRFKEEVLLSKILPGVLISRLGIPSPRVVPLAASEIPDSIRKSNPDFKYVPTIQIEWGEQFVVNIGDMNLAVACKLPYPGWGAFKTKIMDLVQVINDSGIFNDLIVERYSMKYVDLITDEVSHGKVDCLDLELHLSDFKLTDENFNIRFEKVSGEHTHIISIVHPVRALVNDKELDGMIIDVDTLKFCKDTKFSSLMGDFSDHLEKIHTSNKIESFKALSDKTIEILEPEYE